MEQWSQKTLSMYFSVYSNHVTENLQLTKSKIKSIRIPSTFLNWKKLSHNLQQANAPLVYSANGCHPVCVLCTIDWMMDGRWMEWDGQDASSVLLRGVLLLPCAIVSGLSGYILNSVQPISTAQWKRLTKKVPKDIYISSCCVWYGVHACSVMRWFGILHESWGPIHTEAKDLEHAVLKNRFCSINQTGMKYR